MFTRGSHKQQFPPPSELNTYSPPPSVVSITPRRGDVVVFTELLRHGTRRWTVRRRPTTLHMRAFALRILIAAADQTAVWG